MKVLPDEIETDGEIVNKTIDTSLIKVSTVDLNIVGLNMGEKIRITLKRK